MDPYPGASAEDGTTDCSGAMALPTGSGTGEQEPEASSEEVASKVVAEVSADGSCAITGAALGRSHSLLRNGGSFFIYSWSFFAYS